MTPSPALAMIDDQTYPVDGRVVHILANDGADLAGIRVLKDELTAAGATAHVVATHKGAIGGARQTDALTVDRSFHTSSPAEADAVIVAARASLSDIPGVLTYVQGAYRHFKTIGAWGDGAGVLAQAGIDADAPGVVVADTAAKRFAQSIVDALGQHRHWERAGVHPTRARGQG